MNVIRTVKFSAVGVALLLVAAVPLWKLYEEIKPKGPANVKLGAMVRLTADELLVADVASLKGQDLTVMGGDLAHRHFVALSNMRGLQTLTLSHVKVRDEHQLPLPGGLRYLRFIDCDFSPGPISFKIEGGPGMLVVVGCGDWINDIRWKGRFSPPGIFVSNSALDDSAAWIRQCESVRELTLIRTNVGADLLSDVANLPLNSLRLSETSASPVVIERLAKSSSLSTLSIDCVDQRACQNLSLLKESNLALLEVYVPDEHRAAAKEQLMDVEFPVFLRPITLPPIQ